MNLPSGYFAASLQEFPVCIILHTFAESENTVLMRFKVHFPGTGTDNTAGCGENPNNLGGLRRKYHARGNSLKFRIKFKMQKYKILKNEFIKICGRKAYRILALYDFGDVRAGDTGGFIESEANLMHEGFAWVGKDTVVIENAVVKDNALVKGLAVIHGYAAVCGNSKIIGGNAGRKTGNPDYLNSEYVEIGGFAVISDFAEVLHGAVIYQNAKVFGLARVSNKAVIKGFAEVYGEAVVSGNAKICDHASVFGNAVVKGNAFLKNSASASGNSLVTGSTVIMGSYAVGGAKRVNKGVLSGLRNPLYMN